MRGVKGSGKGWICAHKNGTFEARLCHKGRVLARRAATFELAEARLAVLRANISRGKTDGLRARSRRERAEAWAIKVLEVARRNDWSDQYTARVLIAQLSPRRIRRAIFGPCAYCGTWLAATIDHVIPRSLGGVDEPDNLVSACWACNSRKSNRSADLVSVLDARPTPDLGAEAADAVA